jgi:hypothetical protein
MTELTHGIYPNVMRTGRYWFTSPEYPEPQVLSYCAETRLAWILGKLNPREVDASINIIGRCEFMKVSVTEKGNDISDYVFASGSAPPVREVRKTVPFYEVHVEMKDVTIKFVSAAKTYEKRPGYEESMEVKIATTASGSVMIHPIVSSRITKRSPQNDVGEFGL